MDVVREENGGKPRYVSPSVVVDGAGNIFVGIAQVAGVGTQYRKNILIVKVDTAGGKHVLDERNVPDGGLVDGVGIVQSGRFLHVFAGAHIGDPTARLYHYALDVCVPYPTGAVQVGMAGAYEPIGGEPVVEIDYDLVAEKVIDLLKVEMGGEIRQVLEDKTKDSIKELNMWSESMQTRGVDQWVRDRMYQCLVENGLIDEVDVP